MEHRAMEITIKTEVEEAIPRTAHVDVEIDLNHLKQEPELVQCVKSEPVFLVKDDTLEESSQGARVLCTVADEQQEVPAMSTSAIVGRTSVFADSVARNRLLKVKEELEETDMDIGHTVLQHMDSHYRNNQTNLSGIKQEITILNLNPEEVLSRTDDGQVMHSQARDEIVESSLKDHTKYQSETGARMKRCILNMEQDQALHDLRLEREKLLIQRERNIMKFEEKHQELQIEKLKLEISLLHNKLSH